MDSDEEICLSEHALKALNEFYLEKEKNTPVMGAVEEDWVIFYLNNSEVFFFICTHISGL